VLGELIFECPISFAFIRVYWWLTARQNKTANARYRHELLLQEEVYAVVSCAIEILNVRGHGLHEKIYENCLCVEFRLRRIPYTQQERHRVLYKDELVGEYVPDLVVQQQLIVDTKTIDRITDHERGQILNYLRITTLLVGIILNFKHARLEWERLVLTNEATIVRDSGELIL
jgi:GxxExxY protein